ncbi:CLUMA_CG009372, isoform A [Clunio marinus]|uniref:CLUMA_CG009372, isoform A n=1 Tax=Clunio marinus TaxID=568069 RepID=A0A1J1IAE5_9DIPT|nr:CLUMA_CG009372, isoform A [Clunio marinus]
MKLSILAFAVLLIVQVAVAGPQFFSQSVSSSSFTGPNGQVISSSLYTDSAGNRVENGVNYPANSGPPPASQQYQNPTQRPTQRPTAPPQRQTTRGSSKYDSGQYILALTLWFVDLTKAMSFSQSVSSSIAVSPTGGIASNYFYTNSDGVKVVSGTNVPIPPKVQILSRPDWDIDERR